MNVSECIILCDDNNYTLICSTKSPVSNLTDIKVNELKFRKK